MRAGEAKPQPDPVAPTCREAGRRGGMSTLAKRGRAHFSIIGAHGQEVFAARYTSLDRSRWGRLGGRPKKQRLNLGEEERPRKGGMGSPPDHFPPPPADDELEFCRRQGA